MVRTRRIGILICLAAGMLADQVRAGGTTVFETGFETGIPAELEPGVGTTTGVQGYAGLGVPGNQFVGSFLRSPTGNVVTLTVTDLPPHDSISVAFLFAAIDSLDGTGTFPQGDFFRVDLDGQAVFRESFANARADQIQSYDPPPGVELARRVDLGFSGPGSFYTDSAYDMGADPTFSGLPHQADEAVFTFVMEGPGIQPLSDESWAFDGLRVTVDSACLADLAPPHGSLDIDDVLTFLAAFASGDPLADIAAPSGMLDIDDVLAFLASFASGCG